MSEEYKHEQVDSGLGYTCDRGVKDILLAFNSIPGCKSFCSCEASKGHRWLWIEFDCTPKAAEFLRTLEGQFPHDLRLGREWSNSGENGWPVKGTIHGNLQVPPEHELVAIAYLTGRQRVQSRLPRCRTRL